MDVTERLNAIEISSYVYKRGGPFSAGHMYALMKQTRPDSERFCLDHDLKIDDKPHSDSQKKLQTHTPLPMQGTHPATPVDTRVVNI